MKVKMLLATSFMMINGALMAQNAGEDALPPPDQSFWQTLMMIGIALAFFYVIMWRPEQKRRKALEEQRNSLKKGDRVVAMGIIGTVHRIGDQTIILKMVDGSKVEFLKSAITDTLLEPSDDKESSKKEEKEDKKEDASED